MVIEAVAVIAIWSAVATDIPSVAADAPGGAWVEGVVVDPSGAAVGGVRLVLEESATHVAFEQFSDDAGAFRFAGLPAGDYALTALARGFKTEDFREGATAWWVDRRKPVFKGR